MEGDHDEQHNNKVRVFKVDSEDSWTSIVNQDSPIVAHFTASWCMPSVAMIPFVDELALTHPNITFVTVDVDELKGGSTTKPGAVALAQFLEVASKMGVKAMPTFVLMKGGKQHEKLVGANPEEISNMIDRYVASA